VSPKPPTPQAISRLLADKGFGRARNRRIAGVAGFAVTADKVDGGNLAGYARVGYYAGPSPSWRGGTVDREEALADYSRVITEAGYQVQVRQAPYGEIYLLVTTKEG
jgi:hypothetical protein